jgi:hypothetical protein
LAANRQFFISGGPPDQGKPLVHKFGDDFLQPEGNSAQAASDPSTKPKE